MRWTREAGQERTAGHCADWRAGCWASAGQAAAAQGCAQLEQKLRLCMDAPVSLAPSRLSLRTCLTTTARCQPKEEQHQLPSLAHVPEYCWPSQAEVENHSASTRCLEDLYYMYIASHGETLKHCTISVHAWEESTILWINTAFWWKCLCRMHCIKSWLFADAMYFYSCMTYPLGPQTVTGPISGTSAAHCRYCKMYCRGVVATNSVTTTPSKIALECARSRSAD